MKIFKSERILETEKSTISKLFSPDGEFLNLYFLEDGFHEVKIKGETRIPEGTYKMVLVEAGKHHERYKKHYDNLKAFGPGWHRGMIMLLNVPNYTGILIHIGNYVTETEGCLLTGLAYKLNERDELYEIAQGSSRLGYEYIYPILRDAILEGDTYIKIE